jgi:hypothetical protein
MVFVEYHRPSEEWLEDFKKTMVSYNHTIDAALLRIRTADLNDCSSWIALVA